MHIRKTFEMVGMVVATGIVGGFAGVVAPIAGPIYLNYLLVVNGGDDFAVLFTFAIIFTPFWIMYSPAALAILPFIFIGSSAMGFISGIAYGCYSRLPILGESKSLYAALNDDEKKQLIVDMKKNVEINQIICMRDEINATKIFNFSLNSSLTDWISAYTKKLFDTAISGSFSVLDVIAAHPITKIIYQNNTSTSIIATLLRDPNKMAQEEEKKPFLSESSHNTLIFKRESSDRICAEWKFDNSTIEYDLSLAATKIDRIATLCQEEKPTTDTFASVAKKIGGDKARASSLVFSWMKTPAVTTVASPHSSPVTIYAA